MYGIFVVICVFAPTVLDAAWSPGFKVRFGLSGYGETSYIDLPQNVTAAKALNWTSVTRPKGPDEYEGTALVMWCPRDQYTICVLYDNTEFACGILVGLDQETTTDAAFDLPTGGYYNWTVAVSGVTKNYWTIQLFFVSNVSLTVDKTTRIASRNSSQFLQEPNLYVTGINGKLDTISTTPANNRIFKQHNCVTGMGTHYYYNITASFECASSNMYPWFFLENDDYMVGFGLSLYAKRALPDGQFDWLEEYGRQIIESLLKEGPECLYDLGDSPGFVVMHLFFVDHPYEITC